MKNYKVISHHLPPNFDTLVEQALIDGWELVGGVSVVSVKRAPEVFQIVYFQAVAK